MDRVGGAPRKIFLKNLWWYRVQGVGGKGDRPLTQKGEAERLKTSRQNLQRGVSLVPTAREIQSKGSTPKTSRYISSKHTYKLSKD